MTFYPEDDHNPCGGRRKARAHNLAVAILVMCATVQPGTQYTLTRRMLRRKVCEIRRIKPRDAAGDRRATGDAFKLLGMGKRYLFEISEECELQGMCLRYLANETTHGDLFTFLGAAEQHFLLDVPELGGEDISVTMRVQDAIGSWNGESALVGYVKLGLTTIIGFAHGQRTVCLHLGNKLPEAIRQFRHRVVETAIALHQRTYPHSKPSTKPLTRENAAHVSQLLVSPFVRRPCIKRMKETTYVQRATIINIQLIPTEAERAQAMRVADEYNRWLSEFVRDHGLNAVLFKEMVRTRFGVPDLRST